MLKKIFFIIIILAIAVAWLSGIFSVYFSPFSLTIRKPEKDMLRRAAGKAESFIYRGAIEYNPSGDLVPDQIDDEVKDEIKKVVN